MVYESVTNPKIKELKKLQNKKYRDLNTEFLIETPHLITEAYKAGLLKELILKEGTDFDIDVNKIYVSDKVMTYLSELDSSSNIIGVCSYKKEVSKIGNKVLVLEDVQDPGNLGTIIRSAVSFNIDTIILSNDCVSIYNPKVIRSTQGMLFHIDIIKGDLKEVISKLKGYQIIGTDVSRGTALKTFKKKNKFAIIMGNEGKGLSKEVKDLCEDFIYIDMNDNCESLNVAIATSIILYELR